MRRGLGFSSLEKRKLRDNLMVLHNCLRRGSRDGSVGFFSLVIDDRMWENGTKLHQGRISLDIRKNFFTVKVVKSWNRLAREVADAQCQSVFKKHWDNILNNLTYG